MRAAEQKRRERQRRLESIGGTRLGFGSYRRKTIAEVPRSYLEWLAGPDFHGDMTLRWMAKEYLRLTGEGKQKQKQRWRRDRDAITTGKGKATGRQAARQVVRRGKRGG